MKRSLFAELRRRNVFKAAAAYLALGWVVTQVTSTVAPLLHLPEWIGPVVVWIGLIGFPFVIMFSWIYELTPEGLKRESEVDRSASITHFANRRLDYVIVGLLTLAIGLFAFDRFVPHRVEPAAAPREAQTPSGPGTTTPSAASAAPAPSDNSIAVLPFVNISSDKEQEYFSDGLSEELISVLGKISDLKTIGRSSSFHFKNTKDDSRTIGERLGVMNLLEGSVRKQGDRVRIVVDLIKAADGRELWSETYDRELKDIFAIQSEIATAVVEQLKLKLLGAPPPATVNLAAYNALLQGQYFSRRFDEADQQKALVYFEEAVRIDPNYALAHAHLSRTWRSLGAAFLAAPAEINAAYAHARDSAQSALRLAPDLAEAHLAVGWVRVTPDLDLPGAEAEFRRAAALAPHDARTLQALGYLLAALGNLAEGDKMNQQAIDIDPFLVSAYLDRARNQIARTQVDGAEATLRKILELQSDTSHVYAYLTIVDLQRGDAAAALRDAALEPAGFWRDYAMTLAQQAQGDPEAAKAALTTFVTTYRHNGPYQVAIVYAFRKEPDPMFTWLDNAYAERDSGLTQLMVTPFLLDYRADPRFVAFARKLKIDPAVLSQR